MAARQRMRTTDTTEKIKNAIRRILSCGEFSQREFSLPSDKGAQLSLTGDIVAYGNEAAFDTASLAETLEAFVSVNKSRVGEYAEKCVFTALCGECDRSLAMVFAIAELFSAGVTKIVIAADSPTERDNIVNSLTLMHSAIDGTDPIPYRAENYEDFVKYKAFASVYAFLTSETGEILVLSRDGFSRHNNIINRTSAESSLAELISRARPVVLCSAQSIEGARTLAKLSRVFEPSATFLFAGEVRGLRDCVIFKPNTSAACAVRSAAVSLEQITFGEK